MKAILLLFIFILIHSCGGNHPKKVVEIEDGIKKVGYFLNDKLHGSLKKYDSLGNLILESNYINGVIDGKHLEYYSNGNLMYELYFKKGKRDGVMKHYQESGELWEYIYFINDTIQYAKIFLLDGQIVKYYAGAEVELRVLNDSLRIKASLIHSNLKNLETGIVLYGNSKSDTIKYEKGDSDEAILTVHKKIFEEYKNLGIEVCEIDNRIIYARCDAPIEYSNSKNIYYTEWPQAGSSL